MNFKSMVSEKSTRLEKYLEVIEIPSNFRMYDTKSIWVRGLFFSEVEALSKFYDSNVDFEKQLNKLVTIFDDVIKGVNVKDLEIADFLILVSIANFLTFENFILPVAGKCVNLVKRNTEKEKIQKEIEELEEQLAQIDDEEKIQELSQRILNKELEKEALPDYSVCNTPLPPISLEDLSFYEVEENIEEIVEIGGDKIKLKPIIVKDLIEKEQFERLFKGEMNKDLLVYSLSLDSGIPLEERYSMLANSPLSVINKIINYDKKIDITLKPIVKKCPKCGYENKIYVSLNSFKVLP